MKDVQLKPGWLKRDGERATKRVQDWSKPREWEPCINNGATDLTLEEINKFYSPCGS